MSTLRNMIGQKYVFAHGRLSVLIDTLLTQTDVDRLLGAPDIVTAKRALADLPFVGDKAKEGDTEELWNDVLRSGRALSRELVPEGNRQVLRILWIPYDMALLSFLIKEKKHLVSSVASRPSAPSTALPEETWATLVDGGKTDDVPADIVRETQDILAREHMSARDVDRAVAQMETRWKRAIAAKSGSRKILAFVRHTVDLANVRTFLRCDDAEEFTPEFLEGGFLPLAAFTGDRVSFRTFLNKSQYDFTMRDAMPAAEKGEWVELEQAVARVRARDIKEMWNDALGPEPVFAFVATLIEQTQLLRAILIGKQSNLSPQEIKHAVPPLLTASHYA